MTTSPLFSNNSRKLAGLPLRRKLNKRKRHFSRCRAWEDFCAWYDWINEQ